MSIYTVAVCTACGVEERVPSMVSTKDVVLNGQPFTANTMWRGALPPDWLPIRIEHVDGPPTDAQWCSMCARVALAAVQSCQEPAMQQQRTAAPAGLEGE